MIEKQEITDVVNKWLEDKEYFLVDVQISADSRIVVEIDHRDGVWIDDCVNLSRYLENVWEIMNWKSVLPVLVSHSKSCVSMKPMSEVQSKFARKTDENCMEYCSLPRKKVLHCSRKYVNARKEPNVPVGLNMSYISLMMR